MLSQSKKCQKNQRDDKNHKFMMMRFLKRIAILIWFPIWIITLCIFLGPFLSCNSDIFCNWSDKLMQLHVYNFCHKTLTQKSKFTTEICYWIIKTVCSLSKALSKNNYKMGKYKRYAYQNKMNRTNQLQKRNSLRLMILALLICITLMMKN